MNTTSGSLAQRLIGYVDPEKQCWPCLNGKLTCTKQALL